MRKLVFGLILALGVALLPGAPAQADPVTDEAAFVAKINQLRASEGLPALQVHENLVAKARAWASGMAAAGRIWHSTLSDGITADWKKLGENVGMGGSVDGLHKAFVESPGHYANLVDPSFTQVGIGIAMNGRTIYVAEMFMQLMPESAPIVSVPPVTIPSVLTPTTAAPKPTTTTAPRPTTTTASKPRPTTSTTTTTTAPPPPPAAPVELPAPPVEAAPAAPIEAPRAPSPLLVSVLERLRTFDS